MKNLQRKNKPRGYIELVSVLRFPVDLKEESSSPALKTPEAKEVTAEYFTDTEGLEECMSKMSGHPILQL